MEWRFQTSSAPALPGRSCEEETADGVEDEPQIDAQSDGPPWLRRRHGMKSHLGGPRFPPAQVLKQPGLSAPLGSTGSSPRTLLRPGPCRSCRQGGRVPHRRETERPVTGVHAGGTPALPGGPMSHRSCCSRGRAWACRVPHRRETERPVTGVHAGGTPAFPGGPMSHCSCCSRVARWLAGCRIAGRLRARNGGACGRDARAPGWQDQIGALLIPITACRPTPVPVGRVR